MNVFHDRSPSAAVGSMAKNDYFGSRPVTAPAHRNQDAAGAAAAAAGGSHLRKSNNAVSMSDTGGLLWNAVQYEMMPLSKSLAVLMLMPVCFLLLPPLTRGSNVISQAPRPLPPPGPATSSPKSPTKVRAQQHIQGVTRSRINLLIVAIPTLFLFCILACRLLRAPQVALSPSQPA